MSYPASSGSPYSAGAPGALPGSPPVEVRSRTAPTILLLSGLVLCVVAAALMIVSLPRLVAVSSSLSPIDGTGATTRALEADAAYGLYADHITSCTVTAPDGRDVPVTTPSGTVTVNGKRQVGTFTTAASGSYTIACASVGAGGPLSNDSDADAYIGDAAGFGSFASIIVSAISSVFAGIIGLPLLIAGLVWFLVRGSHNKRARQAQVAAGRPGAVQS